MIDANVLGALAFIFFMLFMIGAAVMLWRSPVVVPPNWNVHEDDDNKGDE